MRSCKYKFFSFIHVASNPPLSGVPPSAAAFRPPAPTARGQPAQPSQSPGIAGALHILLIPGNRTSLSCRHPLLRTLHGVFPTTLGLPVKKRHSALLRSPCRQPHPVHGLRPPTQTAFSCPIFANRLTFVTAPRYTLVSGCFIKSRRVCRKLYKNQSAN